MEDIFLNEMKEGILQSLKKSYQPSAELIKHQRIIIEKLEFDLGMSEKYFSLLVQETQTILDEQSEIQDLKESIQKIIDSNIQQLNLKIDRKKEEKERHSSKTTDEGLRDNGRGGCESSMNPLKNSMSAKVETMEASYRHLKKEVKIKEEFDFSALEELMKESNKFIEQARAKDLNENKEAELDESTGFLKVKTTNPMRSSSGDNRLKRHYHDLSDLLPTTKRSKLNEDDPFSSLPPDVITRILNFVPTNDLLNHVSRVSKMFASSINDPDIRLTIKIGRGVQPKSAADLLIRRSYQIEEIIFSQTSILTLKKLSGIISTVKNLKSVRFQFMRNKLPQDLLQKLTRLESLRNVKIIDVPEDSGFHKLGECPSLCHVEVNQYRLRPLEYKKIIALANLRSLSLDYAYTDLPMDEFENGLADSDKSQLVDLSFSFNSINDVHLTAIATNCPNLKCLSIELRHRMDFSKITSNGIKFLFEICINLKTVIFITKSSQEGLKRLLKEGKQMESFKISYENKCQVLIVKKN